MTEVLISATNPNGWKLEDLLSQLRDEVLTKTGKIRGDQRVVAQMVAHNNRRILSLLAEAETLQRESIAALDRFKPVIGANSPRIGIGSEGYDAPDLSDPLGR